MVKLKYLVILLFISLSTFSQEKANPIIFVEFFGGYSGGSSQGWTGGYNLNFEKNKNLFSVRFLGLANLKSDYIQTSPFTILPFFKTEETINEIAVLYGKRFIYDNKSLSFSVGIASLKREYLVDDESEFYNRDNYAGFPFEFNLKWFHANKERYRIYGLIPVGKPISFGRSIGFKIVGNISKTNFIGLGISYGIGFHKVY
jgi:hypothetical protein